MNVVPSLKIIRAAAERISPYAHKTPVFTSQNLNSLFGFMIFFKCENFQRAGAFKFRGACNSVFSLSDEVAANGVATHSSGNHGQALALAAKIRGIAAYIVMPKNSAPIKVKAVQAYGGQIIFCENNLDSREESLAEVIGKKDVHVIHPYNDYRVIAGQATVALEFLEEVNNLDVLLAPVGGGGLVSGTCLSSLYLSPTTEVVGVEPEGANDAYQSLKIGKIIPSQNPNTIADGLRSSLGDKTFFVIQKWCKEIVTVKEESIITAMKLLWQRMKIVVEPSGAVPLAALIENKINPKKKRVGIIISGGNIDFPLGS